MEKPQIWQSEDGKIKTDLNETTDHKFTNCRFDAHIHTAEEAEREEDKSCSTCKGVTTEK